MAITDSNISTMWIDHRIGTVDWLMGYGNPKYWKYKKTDRGYLCQKCADNGGECKETCKMNESKRAWCCHNADSLSVERELMDESY